MWLVWVTTVQNDAAHVGSCGVVFIGRGVVVAAGRSVMQRTATAEPVASLRRHSACWPPDDIVSFLYVRYR